MDQTADKPADAAVVVAHIEEHLKRWDRMATALRSTQVIGAIISAIGPVVLVYWGQTTTTKIMGVLSVAATVATGTLDVGGKANRVRDAHRSLSDACFRFQTKQLGVVGLLRAYRSAESLIGPVNSGIPQALVSDGEDQNG